MIKGKTTEKDVASNLSKYISSPPENSRVVTFTPEIAAWVLETYNRLNRPKKPVSIKSYAAAMMAGAWGLTGDTVKFSDDCRLCDGQNRLMACVRAGAPFTTHVVFGIPDVLFHVMDTGKNRGAADVLSIAGYSNTNNLASAIRWARIFDTDPNSRAGLSNAEALEFIRGPYAGIEASMAVGSRLYSQYNHPVGQMAALHFVFSRVDADTADTFFDAWSSGQRAGRAKAIRHLQDSLARAKDSNHGRIHDTIRAAMVVKGWNLFYQKRTGGSRSCLMQIGEPFPVIEGV